jgi:hypothetical protein
MFNFIYVAITLSLYGLHWYDQSIVVPPIDKNINTEQAVYFANSTTDAELLYFQNVSDPSIVHFMFLGSNSLKDWLINLDTIQVPLNNSIYVHRGFYNDMKSLEEFVYRQLQHNISTVYFSGFSLGGAIAQLMGYNFQYKLPKLDIHVASIGSPKVGNKEWVQWLNESSGYTIVIAQGDLIPLLPLSSNYYTPHEVVLIPDANDTGPTHDPTFYLKMMNKLLKDNKNIT